MNFGGNGGFDEDEFPWDMPEQPVGPPFRNNDFRRPRYGDAYGDYRGGYGPGGGFGPPSGPMHMPPPFMPPMPPPRRGGPFRGPMRGRGFGPGGPPRRNVEADRAIKYLMRCGLTKENLKNLPHSLLMLIQPEYCGLCDINFDSFTMSRMHYISKNHLKNQKKMLSKTQGGMSTNEVPFKSRDLYCELCDIQITSKSHGDAHYEGKPHRGIVEGRKKPKNPLLLQPHMKTRLEQLIRREKRCLKPVKEAAAAEGEEGPAKDPKTVSSELYCEICKTTVTCSEQMTMHMNGKRHLAKEKQHILMMMKGKTNDENQGDGDAGEGDGEDEFAGEDDEMNNEGGNGEAQPDGTQPKDEAKDDDDWGTEAWESQDQTST